MSYTTVKVDLDKCSLTTLIELWLYSEHINYSEKLTKMCKDHLKKIDERKKKLRGIHDS